MTENQTCDMTNSTCFSSSYGSATYGPLKVRDLTELSGVSSTKLLFNSSMLFPPTSNFGVHRKCYCSPELNIEPLQPPVHSGRWNCRAAYGSCTRPVSSGAHTPYPVFTSSVACWCKKAEATVANLLSTLNNNRRPT